MMRPDEGLFPGKNQEEKPYRLSVGMMVVNAEKKIFVGQRIDQQNNAWQMPQGGIHAYEPYAQAACRELKEEIGTDAFEIWAESKQWHAYDFPKEFRERLWQGQYKGQKQRWFLLKFTGTDQDICLETVHPEFSSWRWTTPEELLIHIISFKCPIYQAVLEEFWPFVEKKWGSIKK